ncbi:MAG TPA: CdaR family protein [Candidatus Binataceae bacterium]|nr:CdaR family protein [Candidatus Binataceae bacterium]
MERTTIVARFRNALTRLVVGGDVPRQVRPPLRVLLIQRFRRNLGLRAIALLLAVGLWFFVNAGQRGALAPMRVPISYRALPAGLVIVNQRPDFVQIEVRGPRTLLSLLDPDRLVLRLDLSGVTVGQAVFKIGPEMFNVPRQTDVTRISPSQVVLDIDRITDRQVPIHVDIQGQPATGYRVASATADPPMATIRGPSRFVAHVDSVETSPVEVNGAKAELEQPVTLVLLSDRVKIEGLDRAKAAVSISEIIAKRVFRGLVVEVRDTDYKVKVDPQRIAITVRGPVNQLSGLDLQGSVYVTAEDVTPGLRDLPVQIELPDGIQLVRAIPDNVKVRIYRQKRAGSG